MTMLSRHLGVNKVTLAMMATTRNCEENAIDPRDPPQQVHFIHLLIIFKC